MEEEAGGVARRWRRRRREEWPGDRGQRKEAEEEQDREREKVKVGAPGVTHQQAPSHRPEQQRSIEAARAGRCLCSRACARAVGQRGTGCVRRRPGLALHTDRAGWRGRGVEHVDA